MPGHEEHATLAYTPDERFGVVANVKDYPSFVPWCSGARILHEDQRELVADLVIGFGPFQESFRSQVTLDRPRQVKVHAIEGPLEHLINTWTFTPANDKTHVDFVIDFQFKSHLLDHVVNGMFHEASTRVVKAFEARVHALHLTRHHAGGHKSTT